jgi:hypothetical protein
MPESKNVTSAAAGKPAPAKPAKELKPLEFSFPVIDEDQVPAKQRPMPRSFRRERAAQIFAVRIARMLELSPSTVSVAYSRFMKKFRVYLEV